MKSRENRPISYDEALTRIDELARAQHSRKQSVLDWDGNTTSQSQSPKPERNSTQSTQHGHTVSIFDAVGRTSSKNVFAPHATPKNDTSAMDGFAVCSAETSDASPDSPVKFKVAQCIAAGDLPGVELNVTPEFAKRCRICVEIMTGASFPLGPLARLDAVVKVEDVLESEDWSHHEDAVSRYIHITAPVKPFQHRRPAGSDLSPGDLLLRSEEQIEPKHIAALSSVGIRQVQVQDIPTSTRTRRCQSSQLGPKIGILSTGSEVVDIRADIQPPKHKIPDSNGPYLTTALQRTFSAAVVEYLGVTDDDVDTLHKCLESAVYNHNCDVLITSGGVSRGRYDLVRHVLETRLKADVVFHGVRVRPGGPILVAVLTIPVCDSPTHETKRVVCFGVPGNPVAAASALQFFITPYLYAFMADRHCGHDGTTGEAIVSNGVAEARRKPYSCTAFWLASTATSGFDPSAPCHQTAATVLSDQASYKIKNLLLADSWVIIPEGIDNVQDGARVARLSI